MNWQSGTIPEGVRRPWHVFDEDRRANQMDPHRDDTTESECLSVRNRGTFAVFVELPVRRQRYYAEQSIWELAAYCSWHQANVHLVDDDWEPDWQDLDLKEKSQWIPDNPRAVLVADGRWVGLLADGPPPCFAARTRILGKRKAEAIDGRRTAEDCTASFLELVTADDTEAGSDWSLGDHEEGEEEESAEETDDSSDEGDASENTKGETKQKGRYECQRKFDWRKWGRKKTNCEMCGKTTSRSNLGRHKKFYCRA